MTAEAAGAGPVFVGVARTADVRGYLQGVARSEVVSLTRDRTGYRTVGGGAPDGSPHREQDLARPEPRARVSSR